MWAVSNTCSVRAVGNTCSVSNTCGVGAANVCNIRAVLVIPQESVHFSGTAHNVSLMASSTSRGTTFAPGRSGTVS